MEGKRAALAERHFPVEWVVFLRKRVLRKRLWAHHWKNVTGNRCSTTNEEVNKLFFKCQNRKGISLLQVCRFLASSLAGSPLCSCSWWAGATRRRFSNPTSNWCGSLGKPHTRRWNKWRRQKQNHLKQRNQKLCSDAYRPFACSYPALCSVYRVGSRRTEEYTDFLDAIHCLKLLSKAGIQRK